MKLTIKWVRAVCSALLPDWTVSRQGNQWMFSPGLDNEGKQCHVLDNPTWDEMCRKIRELETAL